MFLATCNEFYETGIDTFQGLLTERLLLCKDTRTFIIQIQDFTDGLPLLILMEHIAVITVLGIGLFREDDRESTLSKLTEETLSGGVGTEVGSVQYTVIVVVAVVLYIVNPLHIAASLILTDRLTMLIKVAPAHKFLDILYLDIVRLQCLDVTEKVLCKGTAVRVSWHSSFGFREIGTLQTGPENDIGVRVFLLYLIKMLHQRRKFQGTDILCKVQGIRMVSLMGGDSVSVMVDASDNFSTLLSIQSCLFYSCGSATGTTKQVYV